MSKLRSQSGQVMFEAMESRQLLSPTISSFSAIPSAVVNQLDDVTLQVVATATEGVSAVTFFRDIDGDGLWSPGTDIDLGATGTPTSPNTYRLTVSPDSGWTRNSRICADAVGNTGQWVATGPSQLGLTVNRQPAVSALSVSTGSIEAGQSLTIRGRATDDSHVVAMTFFLDRNADGSWNQGTDTDLGAVFTPDGTGQYVVTALAGSNWPASSQIVADALDDNGAWSLSPTPITVAVNRDPAPVLSNFSSSSTRCQTGEPQFTVTGTATDAVGVRATTFFLDLDNNATWTPNVDISLDTYFSGNTTATRSVTFTSDLYGRQSLNAYMDAVDVTNHWRGATLAATLQQPAARQITSFYAEELSTQVFRLTADAFSPAQYGVSGAPIGEVQFFIDENDNERYDAGTDRVLGGQTTFTTLGNGERRFVLDVDLSGAPWDRAGTFAAFITSGTGNTIGTVQSSVRQAPARSSIGNVPLVNSITTTVGVDPLTSAITFATPGTRVSASVTWSAASGGRYLTFFFDRNNNGLWDSGIDYDLGFTAVSGTSGTTSFTSGVLPSSTVGFGSVAAAVMDQSSRGDDSWGPARTDSIRQIRQAPVVSSVSGPATAAQNSVLTFSATIADDYGTRAASAFLDVNNNDLDGADRISTTFARSSGTETSSVWQFSINLSGLATGTYTIYVAGVDRYQGSSTQPGGVTSGLWGQRGSYTFTIV